MQSKSQIDANLKDTVVILSDSGDSDEDVHIISGGKRGVGQILVDDLVDDSSDIEELNIKRVCQKGQLKNLKNLVEKGEKADEACVYRAAKNGHYELLEYLLADLKTQFNASTFPVVQHSKILILLLKHKNQLNPSDNIIDSEILKKVENIKTHMKEHNAIKDPQNNDLLELCKLDDIEALKKYLLEKNPPIGERAVEFVLSQKKRKHFAVFLETMQHSAVDGKLMAEDHGICSTQLPRVLKLGWKKEAEILMQKGLRFSYDDIDEENLELNSLLKRFPRQLEFPFSIISLWFGKKHSESFLSVMENALLVKQKITALFRKGETEKDWLQPFDRIFVEALTECMDGYLNVTD